VSIKREPHGAAGAYIDDKLQAGDVVDVSAARGNFTLRRGDAPVVFLSAGIGVTPVLAMLHELAADASPREVWWLYGARDRREHPFAEEMRALLKALVHSHSRICYSSPRLEDRAAWILIFEDTWICACSRSCTCHAMPISIYADRPPL